MTRKGPPCDHLCDHLQSAKNPNKSNIVTTVTTYSSPIVQKSKTEGLGGLGGNSGPEVVTVVTTSPGEDQNGGWKSGRASKSGLPAQPGERYPDRVVGPRGPHQGGRLREHAKAIKGRATRFVALNETGTQRIGEDHHRAKLTDKQVEDMRDDFERYPVGHPEHEGYRVLAKRYGCSKRTARDICNYDKRNQWAARWKRVL